MSKSILVFFAGKPFGVFSNKTNGWMAVKHNYKVEDLCVWSDKKQEYLPASYSMLAARLGKAGKCHIFNRDDVAETVRAELGGEKKIMPVIYVYQFETNVAVDGMLYKSSDKSEKGDEHADPADDKGSTTESDNSDGETGENDGQADEEGEANPPIPVGAENVMGDRAMSHQPGDDEENPI